MTGSGKGERLRLDLDDHGCAQAFFFVSEEGTIREPKR